MCCAVFSIKHHLKLHKFRFISFNSVPHFTNQHSRAISTTNTLKLIKWRRRQLFDPFHARSPLITWPACPWKQWRHFPPPQHPAADWATSPLVLRLLPPHNPKLEPEPEPRQEATMPETSKTHVILLSCGSFNPITYGHIHMFGKSLCGNGTLRRHNERRKKKRRPPPPRFLFGSAALVAVQRSGAETERSWALLASNASGWAVAVKVGRQGRPWEQRSLNPTRDVTQPTKQQAHHQHLQNRNITTSRSWTHSFIFSNHI